jgi:hypothetical protein
MGDDCSQDGTPGIVGDLAHQHGNIRIVRQRQKWARRCAASRFYGSQRGIYPGQDADLDMIPSIILNSKANSRWNARTWFRLFLGGPHRVMYFWHHANILLTLLSNITTNLDLSDMKPAIKYSVLKCSGGLLAFEPFWI